MEKNMEVSASGEKCFHNRKLHNPNYRIWSTTGEGVFGRGKVKAAGCHAGALSAASSAAQQWVNQVQVLYVAAAALM